MKVHEGNVDAKPLFGRVGFSPCKCPPLIDEGEKGSGRISVSGQCDLAARYRKPIGVVEHQEHGNEVNEYAKKGYVTINIDYRLTGEAPFPACIEGVKSSVSRAPSPFLRFDR